MGVEDILDAADCTHTATHGARWDANRCKALIIDSWFDNYVGVVMLVRVVNDGQPESTKTRSS